MDWMAIREGRDALRFEANGATRTEADFRRWLATREGRDALRFTLGRMLSHDWGADRCNVLLDHVGCPPDAMAAAVEEVSIRADVEPWAWEALRRLYRHLRAKGEPIDRWPAPLREWTDDMVMGRRREPSRRRGRKPDTKRAARYLAAVHYLIGFGIAPSREQAISMLAEALDRAGDGGPVYAVRKILDRAK